MFRMHYQVFHTNTQNQMERLRQLQIKTQIHLYLTSHIQIAKAILQIYQLAHLYNPISGQIQQQTV